MSERKIASCCWPTPCLSVPGPASVRPTRQLLGGRSLWEAFASVCRRNRICTQLSLSPRSRRWIASRRSVSTLCPCTEQRISPSRTSPHSYAELSLTKLDTTILPSRVVRNTRPTPYWFSATFFGAARITELSGPPAEADRDSQQPPQSTFVPCAF